MTSEEVTTTRITDVIAEIYATAADREHRKISPAALLKDLLAAGFGALRVPAQFGGSDVSFADYAELLLELARADSQFTHIFRAHANFVELFRAADSAGGDRLLTAIAGGSFVGPGSNEKTTSTGDDTDTQVETHDGKLLLTGTKSYSTGSTYSDWLCVRLQKDGVNSEVVVHRHAPGVTVFEDWDGFGQIFSGTNTVTYEQVVVDPDLVFRTPSQDFIHFRIAYFQFFHSVTQSGILARLSDDLAQALLSRNRKLPNGTSGRTADDPQILAILGEVDAHAATARVLIQHSAQLFDAYHRAPVESKAALAQQLLVDSARVQVVLSRLLERSTWQFFEAGGGSLLGTSRALDRHWRNSRAITSHNPTVYKARQVGQAVLADASLREASHPNEIHSKEQS
ncbi:MAG: acyl-CoA dehydrogenase family protein [Gordonia sp. (in: high G+C Gram-positive bacteria)]